MNDAFVVVDTLRGTLTRWQGGGSRPIRTHEIEPAEGLDGITMALIGVFRACPHEAFRVSDISPNVVGFPPMGAA